ncbi:hypothetical protein, partial [Acinetobacter baumannii]
DIISMSYLFLSCTEKKIILLGNINKGLKPNILNLEENIKNGKLKSCFCCTREGGSKKYEGTSFL